MLQGCFKTPSWNNQAKASQEALVAGHGFYDISNQKLDDLESKNTDHISSNKSDNIIPRQGSLCGLYFHFSTRLNESMSIPQKIRLQHNHIVTTAKWNNIMKITSQFAVFVHLSGPRLLHVILLPAQKRPHKTQKKLQFMTQNNSKIWNVREQTSSIGLCSANLFAAHVSIHSCGQHSACLCSFDFWKLPLYFLNQCLLVLQGDGLWVFNASQASIALSQNSNCIISKWKPIEDPTPYISCIDVIFQLFSLDDVATTLTAAFLKRLKKPWFEVHWKKHWGSSNALPLSIL